MFRRDKLEERIATTTPSPSAFERALYAQAVLLAGKPDASASEIFRTGMQAFLSDADVLQEAAKEVGQCKDHSDQGIAKAALKGAQRMMEAKHD